MNLQRLAVLVGMTLLGGCDNSEPIRPGLVADLASDVTPPTLTALSFSPTSVNTSTSNAQVNVNYTVTDDLSGVTQIKVYFVNPSGTVLISRFGSFAPTAIQSGSLVLSFPQYSESGTWSVYFIEVDDGAGNQLFLSAQDLAALSFPSTVAVSSSIQDPTPPTLTGLSFSPTTINTSFGSATVTVRYTASDDVSGVSMIFLTFCGPSSTSGSISREVDFAPITSVNASFAITFPQYTEVGTWTICLVLLRDGTGNRQGYSSQDLTALSFPTTLQVVNVIPVSIDIQPGSEVNSINSDKQGKVTVAVLSNAGLDAPSRVGRTSLTFGRTGDEASLASCAKEGEDVNGDGFRDLVCQFYLQKTGFQVDNVIGILRGRTVDQVPIEGKDAVRVPK